MRVFATKLFVRFAHKASLNDKHLCEAIARAENGSVDAYLGGSVIKQRVARQGGRRSAGYRTLIAYWASHRSIFLYGFAKSDRDNIDDAELDDLKKLARHFLNYAPEQIATAVKQAELAEIFCHGQQKRPNGSVP